MIYNQIGSLSLWSAYWIHVFLMCCCAAFLPSLSSHQAKLRDSAFHFWKETQLKNSEWVRTSIKPGPCNWPIMDRVAQVGKPSVHPGLTHGNTWLVYRHIFLSLNKLVRCILEEYLPDEFYPWIKFRMWCSGICRVLESLKAS